MNRSWLAATALAAMIAGGAVPALAAPHGSLAAAGPGYADPQDLLDRAAAMSEAIGDAPPDFSVADNAGQPVWAWQLEDGGLVLADPADGATRFVYAAPDADGRLAPFLIRDQRQSIAYDDGAPIALFDRDDRPADLRGAEALARDWWERAAELIAQVGDDQAPVTAEAWIPYSSSIWLVGDWWQHRSYHSDRWQRAPWFARERARRERSHQDWDRWRQGGFHGTAPGNAPHRRWAGRDDQGRPGWNRVPNGATRPDDGARPGWPQRPGDAGQPGRPNWPGRDHRPGGNPGDSGNPLPGSTPLPHRPHRPADPIVGTAPVQPTPVTPNVPRDTPPRWRGRNGDGAPMGYTPPAGQQQPRFTPPERRIDQPTPQFVPRPQVDRPVAPPRFEPRPQVERPAPPPASHPAPPASRPQPQPHSDGGHGRHDRDDR